MKDSLQDLLLFLPLNQLRFLTPIPKNRVIYQKIEKRLPNQWLEEPTLITIIEDHEIERLNDKERAIQLIQDPNVIGIIVCTKGSAPIDEENLTLFLECQLPIVQVMGANSSVTFQKNRNPYYAHISEELAGLREDDLPSILSELAKGLRTPILHVNENHQILWQTGNEDELRAANRWFNTYQRKLDSTVDFEFYPINIPGNSEQGLIVSAKLADWQRSLVDKFVGLMDLFLQTEAKFQEQQKKQQEHFIYDLLSHKFESKKVMVKQAKIVGWNLENPQHLVLVHVEGTDGLTENSLNEMIFFLEERKPEREETIIVFPFLDQIIVLLEERPDYSIKESTQHVVSIAQEIDQQLSGKWPQYQFSIGIGKCYEDTIFLNKSYQEANHALRFGQLWFENNNVYHINDLGVLRLLIPIDQGILADFSQEYLSPLIESDRENGTEFIHTLKAYFQHQGIINHVSDALFVHPNTLRNRIKKIEEMVGVDLQDLEELMNIMMALKVHSFISH